MSRILLLLAWIMSQGTNRGEGMEHCGGVLSGDRGVIQTPNFPRRFPVPLHCRWVIDASHLANEQDHSGSIVVYFTQLFAATGLTFTEFDYYEPDSTFQLGGRLIHSVTEQNVTMVQWLLTRRHYLVIEFALDRLEGNHLRVLDDLLDVYGFNITYETRRDVRNSSCSVVGCSLSGHCYASRDFRDYWCSCFPGFSGTDCGQGPLCQEQNLCQNGGSCRQVGAAAVLCICPENFTGPKCEVPLQENECAEEEGCTTQCPEDASGEPCACGPSSLPVASDRARYEGTVRLTNVSAVRNCLESATCSLKPMLTKQITKYLKNSNLTVMEDLRVIDVGFSGEVRFHFWGGKRDGSRVREALNRLVQKGRLGNVTLVTTHLAITQEPTLHLQSVRLNLQKPVIRQGEEFILSCFAQGSSHMMFRWFKDDVFINITKARPRRNMWTRLLPLDSAELYTALLGVEEADPLDRGQYTCQVTDWGYQQCKSISLEVLPAPQVKVDPMSTTVEKGDNVSVKCTSPNELQYESKFGYSWTKNNALFKMTPNEFWEDLYPGGSILRVSNVQKSVTYSCHVHGSVRSVSRTVRLELLNRSIVPWCPMESGVGGVTWSREGAGVVGKVDCPHHYSGTASRLCLLVDKNQAAWQGPDFSECVYDHLVDIADEFHKLTLGYGNTTVSRTLANLLTYLGEHGLPLPGEGEPVVSLLRRVVSYLENSSSWTDLVNSTDHFFSVVDAILKQRNSIVNHQKVEDLEQLVNQWSLLWGSSLDSTTRHLSYDNLMADLFRYDYGTLRRPVTLSLPRPSFRYPAWYSSRVSLHLEPLKNPQNLSSCLAVINFRNLAEFLPLRYSQTLENGSEVQYEVASSVVSVVAGGPLRAMAEVGVHRTARSGWELRCGVSKTPGIRWNVTACQTIPQGENYTTCLCPILGAFAVLRLKTVYSTDNQQKTVSTRIVLVGCLCCLVQSLLTLSLLTLRWWRHKTCLLFLKLQCCSSTAVAMLVFLYATSHTVHQEVYPTVSTLLQGSVLVSLSCPLSKVLLVHTEVTRLPAVRHLKPTLVCIVTGIPLLVVLCNHIARTSTDLALSSWWLTVDTVEFYTCTSCALLIILAFLFLYCQVTLRLRSLTLLKSSDNNKAVSRRQGLLNRAAIVLGATVIMSTSSAIYINTPTTRYQYLFSFSSALLGFVLLLCYVLQCEAPLHLQLLRSLKLEKSFSPGSDSSPLNIAVFTKEEAERECKAAPPRLVESSLMNGKAEPVREAPPILKHRAEEYCRTQARPKAVTFHNDLVTGCDLGGDQADMEVYAGSPRKYPLPEPPAPQARVCVITSVVVDTPSVVVCSVDVEPCSALDQNLPIVHATVQELPVMVVPDTQLPVASVAGPPSASPKEEDDDVMGRICHDLDYLLGGLPQEIKAEIPRPEEHAQVQDSLAGMSSMQTTTL